jgi:hypothetical protein
VSQSAFAPVSDPIQPGRYEVLARDLRLKGIGSPPSYFWVTRGVAGRYLIESSEDEGYWVREEELERALLNGWIRRAE